MIGNLPKRVEIHGVKYCVRTDFRDILKIIEAFQDAELDDAEKVYICLFIFYEGFERLPESDYKEAFEKAIDFIDMGNSDSNKANSSRVVDWEQDENIMFPAINKVAGCETRSAEYIHWWTFMGYYMEISEGIFSSVLNLRLKKSKGKPLDKWEREFWNENKDICVLKKKLTAEEKAEIDRLNALLG